MFNHLKFNRYTAFATHLVISLVVFLSFLLLMLAYWYPSPFFFLQGGTQVLKILVGVDVILGPIITLIIFVPKKKGLKFDIAVISILQIAALLYGANIIYDERPVFSVFAVDRFVVVGIHDIDAKKLPKEYGDISRSGPIAVYAKFPDDIHERKKIMLEALSGGKDIEFRPETYRPLLDYWDKAKEKSIKYELVDNDQNRSVLKKFFQGKNREDFVLFPIYGRFNQVVAVFHSKTGKLEGSINIPIP